MTSKSLSPEAQAEFNAALERAVQRMERRTGLKATDEEKKLMVGVLAELEREPREA